MVSTKVIITKLCRVISWRDSESLQLPSTVSGVFCPHSSFQWVKTTGVKSEWLCQWQISNFFGLPWQTPELIYLSNRNKKQFPEHLRIHRATFLIILVRRILLENWTTTGRPPQQCFWLCSVCHPLVFSSKSNSALLSVIPNVKDMQRINFSPPNSSKKTAPLWSTDL